MKRRTFLKQCGAMASLSGLARLAVAAPADSAPKSAGSHKLLSCNIRVDVPDDSKEGNGWADRKEICAEVIRAQHADIICLQECQAVHLKHLKSRLPEFTSFALANPDPVFHPANAILFTPSRYEMISAGGFWLSETPHLAGSKSWDSARSRFVNWVDLLERVSGKEFRVWSAHLDHIGQKARENGARMIVEAAAVFPEALPQLFAADCNADTTNPAIDVIRNGGWKDTYALVHGPTDPGFTFHGFKGSQHPDRNAKGRLKGKIDWIFLRGPAKAVTATILRDHQNGRYPSDHYFIATEVTL